MAATAHVDHKRTPGYLVQDAGTFHQLLDGSDITSSTNSGWLDVGMIRVPTQLHSELGTVTGTSPTLDVVISIADDSSGNGAEVIMVLPQMGNDDDKDSKILLRPLDKRYLRVVYTIGGTSTPTFPLTMTLRDQRDHYNTEYTVAMG